MARSTHAEQALESFQKCAEQLAQEIEKGIVGQKTVIRQMIAAIFARGHCLLVGVPGLAKTSMVKYLATILGLDFKRIQFTPDLMPSDITGTDVIEETPSGRRERRFVPGPVFTNIVLADEINRAPPKTQAALLESMQEKQVTVGEQTRPLPDPFFVIATQNPIEQEGTYPLPEAQLDRFMLNIHVDYPDPDEEEEILLSTTRGEQPEIHPILNARLILSFQKLIEMVAAGPFVARYVVNFIRSTRPHDPMAPDFVKELVDWGVGPRAGQSLIMVAKAMAAMDGRFNISIDDIRAVAVPVLRHRICANFQAQAEGIDTVQIIQRLIDVVEEPKIPKYENGKQVEAT